MKKKKDSRLILLKDTRESVETIYNYGSAKWKDKVQMIRIKLPVGDFSCIEHEYDIAIERKTTSDLCGSFTHGRERFERMWVRAMDLRIKHKYLLIEGDINEIIAGEYRSAVHPNSLLASIMSWSLRYKYNWFIVPNIKSGEDCIYWLLKNYLRINKESKK